MKKLLPAFKVLPARIEALVAIATAPNAAPELRKQAATTITENTPIPQLHAFVAEILDLIHAEGGLHG